MEAAPRVLILAGPNGAGKTTFARQFLPNEADCPVFLNADLIAAGLSPFAPEGAAIQAGRLMLVEMARQRVREGGHHIPQDVIRRRFEAGRENFERLYAPRVDQWALYDNSGTEPKLLSWREHL